MALIPSPDLPGEGYRERIVQLFAEADRYTGPGGSQPQRDFRFTDPIESWIVPRRSLVAGQFLTAAIHAQWMTLRELPHDLWHAGEIPIPAGGGDSDRGAWNGGTYYRGDLGGLIADGINRLADSEELRTNDYIPRVLQVVGLPFTALWAHGATDRLFCLSDFYWDGHQGIPPRELVSPLRVLDVLQPLAARAEELEREDTN